MADAKKKPEKKIIDVSHPDDSKPSNTSKPVIVTNRPILKDPMVVEEASSEISQQTEKEKVPVKAGETKIKPLTDEPATESKGKPESEEKGQKRTIAELAAEAAATSDEVEKPAEEESHDEPKEEPKPPGESEPDEALPEDKPEETKPDGEEKSDSEKKAPADPGEEAKLKAEQQAKHDAAIQELVDSKKYALPITTVETRRSRQVVVLGIVLSILLALAWADIALDAGLIEINGVKPVTHFFSN